MNIDTGETQTWIEPDHAEEFSNLAEDLGYTLGDRELLVLGDPALVGELSGKLQWLAAWRDFTERADETRSEVDRRRRTALGPAKEAADGTWETTP